MDIVVSPYHLTTREAPALAALQLADRVVTMLPTPFSGVSRTSVEGAARSAPKYRDFMESWRWSAPLWDAGVIAPTHEGFDAAEYVRLAFDRIASDARYAALRPLMKPHVFETERDYLQAIAGDVLKGGPDPAITVPVAAGIDRFAARHGLAVARAHPTSVSQKAEARLGERLGAFAMPVLTQASAQRILSLRHELADALRDLRASLREAASSGRAAAPGVERAAAEYAARFEHLRDELCTTPDPDEPRVVTSTVAVSLVWLPGGAVLESSLAAMRAMGIRGTVAGAARARGARGRGVASEPEGGDQPVVAANPASATLPAVWDEHSAPVLTLVFKVMGRQ